MAVLLVLFLGRVVAQIVAATTAPSWLPPMARWYSGLMPYSYLLPTQIVFLAVMTAMTIGVDRRSAPLGTLSAAVGAWIVWASYVYALGMVVRSIRYALATPERRGVLIPIVFHFVLAGFVFAYGSAAIERSIVIPSERRESWYLHPVSTRAAKEPTAGFHAEARSAAPGPASLATARGGAEFGPEIPPPDDQTLWRRG
jgi:hypothetical protein